MRTEPRAWEDRAAERVRKERIEQRKRLDRILGLTKPELRSKKKKARRARSKRIHRDAAANPISRPNMGATKQAKVLNRRIARIKF
jgi:hypothetical protein